MFSSLPIDFQLFLAVDDSDQEQAARLIDAGANPNARLWDSLQEDTPLEWVELATNRLAGIAADTPLTRAAHRADSSMVALLLDAGAEVDQEDSHGRCALFQAAHIADSNIVRQMLDAGANVSAADSEDWFKFERKNLEQMPGDVELYLCGPEEL